jgi:hypothetical protein
MPIIIQNPPFEICSGVGLGLAKAGDAIACLPLTTLFEQAYPLKTLQNIPFSTHGGHCSQTTML